MADLKLHFQVGLLTVFLLAFDRVPTMGPDQGLSDAVLTAIADHSGTEPSEIEPPLYQVVDVEALDTLFRDGSGTVTFEYAGYEVQVSGDGVVELSPLLSG